MFSFYFFVYTYPYWFIYTLSFIWFLLLFINFFGCFKSIWYSVWLWFYSLLFMLHLFDLFFTVNRFPFLYPILALGISTQNDFNLGILRATKILFNHRNFFHTIASRVETFIDKSVRTSANIMLSYLHPFLQALQISKIFRPSKYIYDY